MIRPFRTRKGILLSLTRAELDHPTAKTWRGVDNGKTFGPRSSLNRTESRSTSVCTRSRTTYAARHAAFIEVECSTRKRSSSRSCARRLSTTLRSPRKLRSEDPPRPRARCVASDSGGEYGCNRIRLRSAAESPVHRCWLVGIGPRVPTSSSSSRAAGTRNVRFAVVGRSLPRARMCHTTRSRDACARSLLLRPTPMDSPASGRASSAKACAGRG